MNFKTIKNVVRIISFVLPIILLVCMIAYNLYISGWIQKTNLAPWLSAFVASLALVVSSIISFSSYNISKNSLKISEENSVTSKNSLDVSKRNSTIGLIKDLTSRINDEFSLLKTYYETVSYDMPLKDVEYSKFQVSIKTLLKEINHKKDYLDIFTSYVSSEVFIEISGFELVNNMFSLYERKIKHIRVYGKTKEEIKNDIIDMDNYIMSCKGIFEKSLEITKLFYDVEVNSEFKKSYEKLSKEYFKHKSILEKRLLEVQLTIENYAKLNKAP
ncbi:hypothetical protein GHA01_24300 [Novacetimonas hansenii]|uniref:Phage abortive infection protein n=2 Tax=Novacetimonas hansenii TaxID=436 RepID=A0ABQ0SH29_NOVHA|nr:hypothetical protein Gaha_0122_001 [Novacetimonas hansenii JCM 7643]GEC64581.1 hypothetical protein GHA01_24300 [Novacetimonas hansenii]